MMILQVFVFVLTVSPYMARYNVLFLAADDMRPELGAYLGNDFPSPVHPPIHTPNLDALAGKSLLLKRAYVQQALCAPSRASLLTGRRPDTTHVYNLGDYWREVSGNFTTIPQYFKQNGYETIGMGKIFHPGDASNNTDDEISWTRPYFHGEANFESRNKSWDSIPDKLLIDKPLRDEQIANRAIETLHNLTEAVENGDNFFLAVGFQKPHLPFVFPESMFQYYPEESIRLPANPYVPYNLPDIAWYDNGELFTQYADIRQLNNSHDMNYTLPDKRVLDLRRAYHCAITWIDLQVGRILATLEELGLANSTVISFFGDHGYHLGEHAEWGKVSNFEMATHVPLMVHVPGLTDDGIESQQLTELVDLYPTVVEAAGLPALPACPDNSVGVDACSEGISLLPLVQEPNKLLKKAAFSQYPKKTEDVMGYTVRTDLYRYTEWVKFTYAPEFRPIWSEVVGVELYDHGVDPQENFNRAEEPEYRDERAKLSQVLHQGWRHAHQTTADSQIIG